MAEVYLKDLKQLVKTWKRFCQRKEKKKCLKTILKQFEKNIEKRGERKMIRNAIIDDVAKIAEIVVNSWRYAYKDIVSKEVLHKETQIEDIMQKIKKWIVEKEDYVYVYEDDNTGIIKGMMGIDKCEDKDKENAFELHFIYIEPFYSRNGIGKGMIEFFENKGKSKGYKEFIIWVLADNEIGKNCYKKYNYLEDGTTKKYKRLNKIETRYTKTFS